ncbi:MAG: hypothetical protein U0U46_18385 [Saprospiraceae bacterium]
MQRRQRTIAGTTYAWSNSGGQPDTTFSGITSSDLLRHRHRWQQLSDTHSVSVNAITGPTSVCSGGNVTDAGSGYSTCRMVQQRAARRLQHDLAPSWQQLGSEIAAAITGPTSVCSVRRG